jgi:phosphoglycolate phosphatase
MRFPCVILDLNGTLVDTFDDLTDALNETLVGLHRPPLFCAQVRQWPGEGLRGVLKHALAATGPLPTDVEISELLIEFRKRYAQFLGRRGWVHPGVAQTLHTLADAGVHLALLTNKPQEPSIQLLERFGLLRYFEWLATGDDHFARKPDPDGVLTLMAQMGGTSQTTLLCGSSRIDLETARNAGIACALVDHEHGVGVRGMGADYVLDDMSKLVHLVLGGPAVAPNP